MHVEYVKKTSVGSQEISVIIPTYKPGEFIQECLNSLLAQTLDKSRFEIVIVLNGCNQPYRDKLINYINNHPDLLVTLLQTETPGVSNARNIGIEYANGDFLCFIDDDDMVSPTYLEELYSISSTTCVGCSNSRNFIDNIDENNENFISHCYSNCIGKKYKQTTFRGFLSPPFCKMIHKNIIKDNRFNSKVAIGEDSLFCAGLVPRIQDMKLASKECIYFYRQRPGSAIHSKKKKSYYIKNMIYAELGFASLYCKYFYKYNFIYFISRVLGTIYVCLYKCIK